MRIVNGVSVYSTLYEILSPEHTALLVVDMQNDGVLPTGWWATQGRDVTQVATIVPTIRDLIAAARRSAVYVVLIEQTTLPDNRSDPPGYLYFKTRDGRTRTDYQLEGTWGQETISDINPQPGDTRVRKHRSSAFHGTDLDLILRAKRIESIAVCGIVTQGCVMATVLDATFHNYYTVLVSDCVQSYSPEQHDIAMRFMGSRYDLVTSSDVIPIWSEQRVAGASGTT
jgi:nicotinamidase-related amidase